jgi:hypothetical protein
MKQSENVPIQQSGTCRFWLLHLFGAKRLKLDMRFAVSINDDPEIHAMN